MISEYIHIHFEYLAYFWLLYFSYIFTYMIYTNTSNTDIDTNDTKHNLEQDTLKPQPIKIDTTFNCVFIEDDDWLDDDDDEEEEEDNKFTNNNTIYKHTSTPIPTYENDETNINTYPTNSYISNVSNPVVNTPSNPINSSLSFDELFESISYDSCENQYYMFCCLCGVDEEHHNEKNHMFVRAKNEYLCKECGLFYYQHNHLLNPCFQPTKWILDS